MLSDKNTFTKGAKAPKGIARAIVRFKDFVDAVPKGKALAVVATAVAASIIIKKMRKAISKKRFFEKRDTHLMVDGEIEHDGI
jgi:hypothetical protein